MVAVVTGSGLGLTIATRSNGESQLGRGNENVFVNTTNGNLIIQSLDENLTALGLDLALVRTYNSQGQTDGDNDDGWRFGTVQRVHSLTGTLNTEGSTIKKVFGDGSEITYTYRTAFLAYVATDGDNAHDTLTSDGSTWTWTNGSSRVRETYNWVSNVGRIQSSIDPNGNTVAYFYNGNNLLSRVRMAGAAPVIQDVHFDYYASTNDVEKIRVESTDASGLTTQTLTRYTYDAQHRLVTVRTDLTPLDNSVADNNYYLTTYAYEGTTHLVSSITQTRGTSPNVISKVSFTYVDVGGTKRVRTVRDGEGRVNTYDYSQVVVPGGNSSQAPPPGWSSPQLLSAEGMSVGSIPRVAFDADGNGFALWNADNLPDGTSRNVAVRRYTRATNSWGPEIVLDNGGATQGIRTSTLDVDDNGNAIVAWSQSDGAGTYSVYASRYSVASGTWSATPALLENIPNAVDFNDTTNLSAAVAGANAAVSWIQSDGSFFSTYVARWNGSTWTTALVETASNNARQTVLDVDAAGNVVVTWIQPNGSSVDTVYANRFDAAAATWAGAQALSGSTSSRPQVVMDFAGNALAVWVQNGDIVGRRYDKAGGSWQPQFTIDTGANPADVPSLAMDRQTGAGFVAWVQSDGTAASVFARQFSGVGATFSATVDTIDITNEAVNATWQQNTGAVFTAMRGGQGVVLWSQNKTVEGVNYLSDIMARRLSGGTWQSVEHLSNSVGMGGGFFGAVAIDPQGNVAAAWDQYYSNGGVFMARYTAPGAWTGPSALSDAGTNAHFVKSAADGYGNIVSIYLGDDTRSVFARRYDKATNTWGPPTALDTLATTNNYCQTAISVDDFGNALAVWNRNAGSGHAVYASRYDVLTNTWGAAQLIQSAAQPVDLLRPGGFAVQISGEHAIIAWLQKTGTNQYDVYAARYAGGAPVLPAVQLDTGAGNATYVAVSVDKAGNSAAVWQQFDATAGVNIDRIFTRRFSGGSWDSVSPLSGTTTAAGAPQLGFDVFGNGLAIWSQGNDVYAARYTFGSGWGTPTAIDNVVGAAESTTLSVDRMGNAIAAWIQTDAGVKSLYAARYTPAGGWSPAVLLENASQAVRTNPGTAAFVVSTSIRGSHAAVSWLQKTGAGDQGAGNTEAWVNRWNGSAWSGAEMVSNTPGLGVFDPSVTVDHQGNTAVFFSRYTDRSQAWVNRYNVNTAYAGSARFGLSALPGANGGARVAFDAAGNGVAILTRVVGGGLEVYSSLYNKARNTWSAPELRDTSATGTTGVSSVAMDDGGNAVIAWTKHDGTAVSVHSAIYSARTGKWGTAVPLESTADAVSSGAITDLSAAISNEGNAAVAFIQGGSNVHVARWNGSSWSATPAIDSQSTAASNVSAAIDHDGNVVALWLQSDGTAVRAWRARYTATSATPGWGSASRLDTSSSAAARPQISFDGFGNGIAVWVQDGHIHWSRYDRAGTWTAPAAISTGSATAEVPSLSVDAMGNALVAWVQNDGVAKSTFASRFTAGVWSTPVAIESSTEPVPTGYGGGYGNPIASIRGNQAVVGWAQKVPTATNPFFTSWFRARWDGTSWSAAESVDHLVEHAGGFMGSAFVDYQGNVHDFYAQWQSTTSNTFTNRYTAPNSYTQTTVADGHGRVTIYKHDPRGRLVSVSVPTGNGTRSETRYQYDSDGNINAVIEDATGTPRTSVMIYDTRGNLVISRAPDGTTTRRIYDAKNQLQIEQVYRVSDVVGGPRPAPQITRYYYDGNSNLRFVVSSEGRVTEHRYYPSGAIGERQHTFVYTAASYLNPAYDLDALEDWVDVPANAANAERTDYVYDGRGNLAATTRWSSFDVNGVPTGTPSTTRFTFDQRGLLKQKIEPRGEGSAALDYYTSFLYDGMRRVTSEVQWLAGTTTRTVKSITYDDVNNAVATTLANGTVSTSVFDRSGRLVSEARSQGGTNYGTTLYHYDHNGRLVMTTSPAGDAGGTGASAGVARSFVVYDEAGRKAADVDGDGTLTRYEYNATHQVIKTTRYSSLLPESMLTALTSYGTSPLHIVSAKALVDSLAGVPGRDPLKDKIVYNAYDAAGRLAATVDVAMYYNGQMIGAITRFHYSGQRLTDTIAYNWRPLFPASVTIPSLADVEAAMAGATDSSKDRRTRNFYDGDGHLIGTLDPEGYLTRHEYDAAGRLTKTHRHANVSPPGQWALGDLVALTPPDDNLNGDSLPTADDQERDIVTRYFYDGQGRRIGELDGEGYLTETQYDVDGNVTQTSRYLYQFDPALPAVRAATFATLRNSVAGLAGVGVAAKVTKFEYDGARRVVKTTELTGAAWTDPEIVAGKPGGNGIPHLAFDSAGNGFLVTTTNVAGDHNDLMVRRYDAVTKTWGAATFLDISVGRVYNAKVAMDDAGNAVVTWNQDDGNGTWSVYGAVYTPSGGWTASTALETSNQPVDYYSQPRISTSIASASAAAAAWVQFDGTNYSTYVSRWNGSTWSTAKVDNNTSASGATTDVSVAIDTLGRTTAVWLETTTGSANSDIRYARYSGGSWSAAGPLDSAVAPRSYAQVAFDASGDGFAIWVQGTHVRGSRFTAAGGWQSDVQLSAIGNAGQVEKPTLAISSTGEAVVAWAQPTGDSSALSLHAIRWNGSSWSTPALLENSTEPVVTNWQQASRAVFVAMRGTQAVIGWMQHQPVGSTLYSNSDIMVSRWNGTGWDRPEAVEHMANGWGAFFLSVGIDAQGNAFAAFSNLAGDWQTRVVRSDVGDVTTYELDNMDAVTKTVRAAGTGEARTTQARYDALNRKTQELTAEGAAVLAARLAATPAPTQSEIEAIWTDYGTRFAYDNAGRLISSTQRVRETSAELKTRYYYDADGRLRFVIDPRGQVKETRYDALDKVSAEIGYYMALDAGTLANLTGGLLPAGLESTLRQTANVAYDSATTYEYNTRGELERRKTAAGGHEYFHYNAFSEVDVKFDYASYTDPNDYRRTEYQYDRRGSLKVTTWDRLGINSIENRNYDAFGRLVEVIDPRSTAQAPISTKMEYDRLGRQIATVDPLNARRKTTYDALSRVTSSIDAYGKATTYSYNDNTRRVIVSTPEGIHIATEHNRHGEVVRVTNGTTTTTYAYDGNGQLTSASDGLGALESRTYDSVGRQITAKDARDTVTTFSYDASNRLLTRTFDPTGLNLVTTYGYGTDGSSAYVDTTEPGGRITRTTYDQDGRTTSVTYGFGTPDASKTSYTYDRTGLTLDVVEGQSADPAKHKPRLTTYVYDKLGRKMQKTVDPAGLNIVTLYKYDAAGNLTRTIEASGKIEERSTWFVYDASNRVQFMVDAERSVTGYTYDQENRVVATRRYAAYATGTLGDVNTSVSVVADAAVDRIERTAYDRDGRAAFSIDALGYLTERRYDRNGNVIQTLVYQTLFPIPGNATAEEVRAIIGSATVHRITSFVYDARDRRVFTVDAEKAITKTSYDAAGNVIAVTQYATQSFTGDPLSMSALTAHTNNNADASADRTTLFWYDRSNRVRYALDAEKYLTETQYDDANRRQTDVVIDAYAGNAVHGALSLEQVDYATRTGPAPLANAANDAKRTTQFDVLGRVLSVTRENGANDVTESYTYDAVGNKKSYTNARGAVWDYEYDAAGRLTAELTPTVASTEIVAGANLTHTVHNARIVTRMSYDAFGNVKTRTEGLLKSGTNPDVTTFSRTTSYAYDKVGRQTTTTYPTFRVYTYLAGDENNTNAAAMLQETDATPTSTVTYDAFGDAVVNLDVGGQYSHKAYDKLGRVVYEADALRNVTRYTYDAFGSKETVTRFATAMTAPAASAAIWTRAHFESNLPAAAGSRTMTMAYDKLGRQTSVTEPATFVYTTSSTSGTPQGLHSGVTQFTYDAFGQVKLQQKLLVPSSNPAAQVWADTYFFYDRNSRVVTQIDPEGYVTKNTYDERGNLTRKLEYFSRLATPASGWTAASTPPAPPAGDFDHDVSYEYDLLDRMKSQTVQNVEYSTITTPAGAPAPGVIAMYQGAQTTTFGYDAVGNRTIVTDANNQSTFTFYDVLGRITAVVEVARDTDDSTATADVRPLTEMYRDVYGNLVQEIRYSGGATNVTGGSHASPGTYTAATASGKPNQTSRLLLDKYGHAIRTQDSLGGNRYASYDVRGNVAKEWQPIANADGNVETAVTIHKYDELGREIAIIEPQRRSDALPVATSLQWTSRAIYNYYGSGGWTGTNTLAASWQDLSSSATFEVRFEYYRMTQGGGQGTFETRSITSAGVQNGASTSWTDTFTATQGGIHSVSRVRVYAWNAASGQYDVLVRDSAAGAPAPTIVYTQMVYTKVKYNAFGEITGKGVNMNVAPEYENFQEFYDYDDAGRVMRTNSGDGVTKMFLYDVAGRTTAEIRSKQVDLRTLSQEQAANLGDGQKMLTEKVYNEIDQVTSQRMPRFSIGDVTDPVTTSVGVGAAVAGPSHTRAFHRREQVPNGGSPVIYYYVLDPSVTGANGGWYRETNYNFVQQSGYSITNAPRLYWGGAWDFGVTATFKYWVDGTSNYQYLTVYPLSQTQLAVNLAGIASANYRYEITYRRNTESIDFARTTGTFNVNGGSYTASVDPPPTNFVRPDVEQKQDRWGNVTEYTDTANNVTKYRYSVLGNLVKTTLPSIGVVDTRTASDPNYTATPTEAFTYAYYDLLGRKIGEHDANGNLEYVKLNNAGQRLIERHADLTRKDFEYDAFGNNTKITDALLWRTLMEYNEGNMLTRVQREVTANSYITVDYGYDHAGRRISETSGEAKTGGGNETTHYFYDLRGNVQRRRSAQGFNTLYEYDGDGHKIKETNGTGMSMSWTVDHFGRVTGHVDLAGVTTVFDYAGNYAGLLARQYHTNTMYGLAAQNIYYEYDDAGNVTLINDVGVDRRTLYAYDAAGRRSRERTVIANRNHQNTTISYDALNRISRLSDLRYTVDYYYDKQGNRTRITATYKNHQQAVVTDNLWYKYDVMNRVVLSQGVNVGGALGINENQGIIIEYDAVGQRKRIDQYGSDKLSFRAAEVLDQWYGPNDYTTRWEYLTLTVFGRYTESYTYDGAGRLKDTLRSGESWTEYYQQSPTYVANTEEALFNTRGYDNASRLTRDQSYGLSNAIVTSVYDDDGRLTTQTTRKGSDTAGRSELITNTYDAANVLRQYTVDQWTGQPNGSETHKYTSQFFNTYYYADSALLQTQSVSTFGPQQPTVQGQLRREYNANRELTGVTDQNDSKNNRYFANNAAGQQMTVVQGQYTTAGAQHNAFVTALAGDASNIKAQHFFFANGQHVGSFGQLKHQNGVFKANFDVNYTPVTERFPTNQPQEVVTQQGDTLRTVAQRVYGDVTLWYLLAEENGYSNPDQALQSGIVLHVPNRIVANSNDAASYKPFDPSDAIGDMAATQKGQPIPPASKKGCGILGMILVIVVVIVVTAVTYGALTAQTTSAMAPILAGAAAGAVGSVAGQLVGMALGMQEGFDWKAVALGAISGAVGAGLGEALKNVKAISDFADKMPYLFSATEAAAGSIITQGISVAVGLQDKFNWRDVAIAAVAAPIAKAIGDHLVQKIDDVKFKDARTAREYVPKAKAAFVADLAKGMSTVSMKAAIGGKFDARQAVADVFGNTFGNSLVKSMQGAPKLASVDEPEVVGSGNPPVAPLGPTGIFLSSPWTFEGMRSQFAGPGSGSPTVGTAILENADGMDGEMPYIEVFARRPTKSPKSIPLQRYGGGEPTRGRPRSSKPSLIYSDPIPGSQMRLVYTEAQMNQFAAAQADRKNPLDKYVPKTYLEKMRAYQSREPEWIGDLREGVRETAELLATGVEVAAIGAKEVATTLIQTPAQVLDLAELTFVALPYNLFSDDPYQLTGFSRVADATSTSDAFRAALSPTPLGGVFYGGVDVGTGIYEGDGWKIAGGAFDIGTNMLGAKLAPSTFGEVGGAYTPRPLGTIPEFAGRPRLNEFGPVENLLYGAPRQGGLPGSSGVDIPRRPTPLDLENMTAKHDVEFAVTYELGPGKNGGGGQYRLYSGVRGQVDVPLRNDSILIYHTHPQGRAYASEADRNLMRYLREIGSPQRSSQIVPVGGQVVRFDEYGTFPNGR